MVGGVWATTGLTTTNMVERWMYCMCAGAAWNAATCRMAVGEWGASAVDMCMAGEHMMSQVRAARWACCWT